MTTKTLQAPRLVTSDKLLSSTILLPKDVLVSCFVYTPLAGPSSHSRAYNDILELARRQVHTHNGSATLAQSILTSVHLGGSDSCMYAFQIGREGHPPAELSSLQFDGLIGAFSLRPGEILPFRPHATPTPRLAAIVVAVKGRCDLPGWPVFVASGLGFSRRTFFFGIQLHSTDLPRFQFHPRRPLRRQISTRVVHHVPNSQRHVQPAWNPLQQHNSTYPGNLFASYTATFWKLYVHVSSTTLQRRRIASNLPARG